jgi:predicted dehydrogenase
MDSINIGVLGLNRGKRAAEVAHLLSQKARIAAVCDRNQELADKVGASLDCNAYHRYEDMLQDEGLDAVFVASPIPDHADHVIQALQAGKHVMSEVTALTDMQDCQRLQDAVKASGKMYMLAENYCYLRSWLTVMNMVRDGVFGEVYYAEGDYLMNFHGRGGFPHIGGWREEVYHMHRGHVYITHSLGPLAQAFGEPIRSVCCVGSGSHPKEWGLRADCTCNLLCQTESKKLIRLRQDFLSPRPNNYLFYAIQGTKGAYEGGRSYPGTYHEGDRRERRESCHKVHIKGLCGNDEWRDLDDFKEYVPAGPGWLSEELTRKYGVHNDGTAVMFDDFASAILEGRESPIGLSESLNWTATGLLSEQSADADGMPVRVPLF